MSDDDVSDLPDLEAPFGTAQDVMVDKQKLSCGDPAKQYDESQLETAMQKRASAVSIYKSNINEALLLITDCIDLFPNSNIYLNTRAEMFRYNGDFQLAIRDLLLAERRNGENTSSKTHRMLSEIYFDSQEFESCIKYCKRYLAQENDQSIRDLMAEAEERLQRQQNQQQQFERQQERKRGEEKQCNRQEKERTINDDIQDEIRNKYGDNPVYQSDLFQNLFSTAQHMDDDKASQLMQNQVLMAALNDPDFGRKIAEVAKDPSAGAKYVNDKAFMQAFQTVLGAFK